MGASATPSVRAGSVPLRLLGEQTERRFEVLADGGRGAPAIGSDGVGASSATLGLPPGASPFHARGLRVALAMKGGVSLAVWIGGAIGELDVLRRIRIYRMPGDEMPHALFLHTADGADPETIAKDENLFARADVYARMLCSRGYDKVEFDVLAGASAGGLNGVLYAVAQRAGVGLDGILDTWLETASAWNLLQPGGALGPDSVLRGDRFFWPELDKALGRISTSSASHPALVSPTVVVDLSATLIDARDGAEHAEAEGHANFRFVGTNDDDRVPDRGIPGPDSTPAQRTRDLARLAYAARSTSSFPGAFEPALIYSSTEPLPWNEELPGPPDMRTVFNAHRAEGHDRPFRVVDGGVLDNIPIDRAMRAIRNIPADEHVNRALVYLDPSPKEELRWLVRPTDYEGPHPSLPPDTKTHRNDPPSRFFSAVFTALSKRRGESADDEIEAVDAFRAAAYLSKGRDELLAVRLDGDAIDDDARPPRLTTRAAYTRYRSTSDVQLLAPALLRPGEWTLGTNLVDRPVRKAISRESMDVFERALRLEFDAFDGVGVADVPREAIARGSQSIVDAAYCALAWIRSIEDVGYHTVGIPRFDAALSDAQGARGWDRAGLRRDLYAVMSAATDLRNDGIALVLDRADDIPHGRALITEEDGRALALTWLAANGAAPTERERLWSMLDGIVARLQVASAVLAGLSPMAPAPRTAIAGSDQRLSVQEAWAESKWSRLPAQGIVLAASDLPLIFAGSGIPQPVTTIRFHRIGSDAQPAHVEQFSTLVDAQLLEGYRAALRKSSEDLNSVTIDNLLDDRTLRSSAKLAGLRIANFAGFLSKDWRRNDWWWGRMDAASGFVAFLDRLPSAPSGECASLDRDSATAQAQNAILGEMSTGHDAPYTVKGEEGDPVATRAALVRGSQDLDSLRSGYRVALVSRVLRTASNAMPRGIPWLSPRRFIHWLLRPVLVLAPTLMSLPRLVLSCVLLACTFLLVWPLPDVDGTFLSDPVHWIVAVLIVLLPAARLISAETSARRRRASIDKHTVGMVHARAVMEQAERRARSTRVLLTILTVLIAIGLDAVLLTWGARTVAFVALGIALIACSEVTSRAFQTVAPARVSVWWKWPLAGGVSIAAVAVALFLPHWARQLTSAAGLTAPWDSAARWAVESALVAVAFALTLFVSAIPLRHLVKPLLLSAVAAALVGFGCALLTSGFSPVAQQVIGIIAVWWVIGTVLWWSPWSSAASTDEDASPSESVLDIAPGSLVPKGYAGTS
ncbi:MAG: DUF3376 domain-containing protein [Leifsonia sp.]